MGSEILNLTNFYFIFHFCIPCLQSVLGSVFIYTGGKKKEETKSGVREDVQVQGEQRIWNEIYSFPELIF